MFINWTLEIIKWKSLVEVKHKISFRESAKAVLMGITLGMVSPFRVGEFAGRLLVLPKRKMPVSVASSLYGSISQNFWILVFGAISLKLLIPSHPIFYFRSLDPLILGILGVALIVLIVYFLLPVISQKIRTPYLKRRFPSLHDKELLTYTPKQLFFVLLLSGMRYAVFCFQFYLLLVFFGMELMAKIALPSIPLIYAIQSGIPIPGVLSAVARGEIAIMVLSSYNVNEITILISSLMIWIINLLLPSLIGLILIWFYNFRQIEKHGNEDI